jgi:carboxymethylenebutenolidase
MQSDPVGALLHLFEDGAINRRDLVQRLTKYTGSVAAALAAIESAGYAQTTGGVCPEGIRVPENDRDLISENTEIWGEGGPLKVHLSRPLAFVAEPRPAVVVVHENRGLNEHIKDVTRRLAKAGYVAIAVDLLSRQGGTDEFPDPQDALSAYNRTVPAQRREDVLSTLHTIGDQTYVRRDRVGAIGFCAGGGNVWDLALNTNRLAAAAVYYATSIPTGDDIAARLSCPMLCINGELDRSFTAALGPAMTAMANSNKRYEVHVYQNARHAFNNDTGANYDAAAACDAWSKTLAFFQRHLNPAQS